MANKTLPLQIGEGSKLEANDIAVSNSLENGKRKVYKNTKKDTICRKTALKNKQLEMHVLRCQGDTMMSLTPQ